MGNCRDHGHSEPTVNESTGPRPGGNRPELEKVRQPESRRESEETE